LHGALAFVRKHFRHNYDSHDGVEMTGAVRRLEDLPWNEFLERFVMYVRTNGARSGILNPENFDELRAMQLLMWYDNFHILTRHEKTFEGTFLRFASDDLVQILIESLFDEFNTFNASDDQITKVESTLKRYLILHTVLYPFMITYFIAKLFVKNVAVVKSKPTDYFAREWTPASLWKFRLYNEVEHLARARYAAGSELTRTMLAKSKTRSESDRFAQRLAATVIFIVVVLTVLNSFLITEGVVGGRTLLWWMTGALFVYSATAEETPREREYHHLKDLKKLTHHLHYDEDVWESSSRSFSGSIKWTHFHLRLYINLVAVLSAIFAPIILLRIYCDQSVPVLIQTLNDRSHSVSGVGCFAAPSVFAPTNLPDTPRDVRLPAAESHSFEFKRERSIASFAAVYEVWGKKNAAQLGIPLTVKVLQTDSSGTNIAREISVYDAGTAHDREALYVALKDNEWATIQREFTSTA